MSPKSSVAFMLAKSEQYNSLNVKENVILISCPGYVDIWLPPEVLPRRDILELISDPSNPNLDDLKHLYTR